ncbi:MAG: SRPBCC family protein [Saprospiraceae bacterium]
MLKYNLETEIEKPLDQVIRLFTNRSLLPKWQPGLVSDEIQISQEDLKTYKLTYQVGRRKLSMTETITCEVRNQYNATYKLKGVVNHVRHHFESIDALRTTWRSEQEFRFKGLMKLISLFMRSGFENQSRMIMNNFKQFAEKQ